MNNILNHLPVLIVAVPLIGAPLCVLLKRSFPCWLLCTAISTFALAGSIRLLSETLHGRTFEYALGGWSAPWGIAYQVTTANALIACLISLISVTVTLYAKHSIIAELTGRRIELFFATWLLCLCGLLGVVVSNDLFNIFIFLEIAALSSYVLIAFAPGGRAPLASFRYLLASSLGATFLLIGIGYLYALTGTLNLDDLAARLPQVTSPRALTAAFAFISFGLLLKIALFPLHVWQPDVYTYAPSAVSAWLSATTSKVAIYLLMRLFLDVFAPTWQIIPINIVLMILASGAIVFGAVIAAGQHDLKRLLAYSSISQVGYILLGVALMSTNGVQAALIHLFNHSLIKAGVFLAVGCIVFRLSTCHLNQLAGLGHRMPWTAAALTTGGLSLIGLPLTSGFISKWYLIDALLKADLWPLVIIVLAGSVIAVVYVWRIVEKIYATPPSGSVKISEAPLTLLLPTWFLIGLNLYLGVQPDSLVFITDMAANTLLGGSP